MLASRKSSATAAGPIPHRFSSETGACSRDADFYSQFCNSLPVSIDRCIASAADIEHAGHRYSCPLVSAAMAVIDREGGWRQRSSGRAQRTRQYCHCNSRPVRDVFSRGTRTSLHGLRLWMPLAWSSTPSLLHSRWFTGQRPAFGLKLSQTFNNACSALHLEYPERFVGLAMLPMQAPDLAVR